MKPLTISYCQFSIILLCLVATTSCSNNDSEAKVKTEIQESVEIKPEVIFDIADSKELSFSVESQGIIEADRQITIQPRINGYLKNWSIYDGKFVNEGDELISFTADEWELSVKEAQDKFIKAQTDYSIEKRQREINGKDYKISESEFDLMLKNQTGFTQAEVNLDRAKLNLSYTKINAPFTGYIQTKLSYQKGQYINAGIELGRLIDQTKARVRLEVLESEIVKIKSGMRVKISHSTEDEVYGVVTSVSPSIDPSTKTGQVTVQFENKNQKLKSGMTVQGLILIQSVKGKCRVPRSAILDRDDRQLLFKLKNDEVEWIYITPVAMNSEWAILNEDSILPGDTIAVDQHFAISHLQKVTVKVR